MEKSTTVTIGKLGEGERVETLEPGESIQVASDGPMYVEIVAHDDEISDSGGESRDLNAGDTTYEQEQTGDDRVWEVDTRTCQGCGNIYPDDYTRCGECGQSNPDV